MKIIRNPKLGGELEILPYQSNEKIYAKYYGGIQAGFPSPAEDFTGDKLSLDEKYISNPTCTFILKVKGHSMHPFLELDDILIVKSDEDLIDGSIAVVSVNNSDYTVKKFDKKNKVLIALNPEYKNIEIQEDDTILCLGIVRHLIRDIN